MQVCYDVANGSVYLKIFNTCGVAASYTVVANGYFATGPWTGTVAARSQAELHWPLKSSGRWYDFTLTIKALPGYARRFAGRVPGPNPSDRGFFVARRPDATACG